MSLTTSELLHEYFVKNNLDKFLKIKSVCTPSMVHEIKYSKIERFEFNCLCCSELKLILAYCEINYIEVWLAFNLLCFGFRDSGLNYKLEVFA